MNIKVNDKRKPLRTQQIQGCKRVKTIYRLKTATKMYTKTHYEARQRQWF